MHKLLTRVLGDPVGHLSCRSLHALQGYLVGYDEGCRRWGLQRPPQPDPKVVLPWLRSQVSVTSEHAGRLNAFNWLNLDPWAHFLACDDREAFDVYFDLLRQMPPTPLLEFGPSAPSELSLIQVLEALKARHAMYFGNGFTLLHVWAFCSGFRWAERDSNIIGSLAEPLFTSFPTWLEARYPFSRGVPWHRLFTALALGHPSGAFDSFFEHLQLHLSGLGPGTEDPTMKAIIENIRAHVVPAG